MTIPDEMKDYDKYNMIVMSEFYEFLGRWADLLYLDQIPLIQKLGKLLPILL